MRRSNDNKAPDQREVIINKVLTANAVVQEHLTIGLKSMLASNGTTPAFGEAIDEFLRPAIGVLNGMEQDVVQGLRGMNPPKVTVNALTATLDKYAELFEEGAITPDQEHQAARFREFATEMGAALRDQDLPFAVELQEPEIER